MLKIMVDKSVFCKKTVSVSLISFCNNFQCIDSVQNVREEKGKEVGMQAITEYSCLIYS